MGIINHGTQSITFQFNLAAKAEYFNKLTHRIQPPGVYWGGHLIKVSDSIVTLTPFAIMINDGDEQVSVSSIVDATLSAATLDSGAIDAATPYLVFRWVRLSTIAANYVEVHATAAAQPLDVVIGKMVFSGSILTGFDYSDRTEPRTLENWLKPEATETSELYIYVRGGQVQTALGTTWVATQKVGPFVVPASPKSRKDLVYVDTSGALQILQGTAAPAPVAPNYLGKLVVAEVLVANGVVDIIESVITDVRCPMNGPVFPDESTITRNVTTGLLEGTNLSAFGARTALDSLGNLIAEGGVYQVPVDGFIAAYQIKNGWIQLFSDGNNPPTTLIHQDSEGDMSTNRADVFGAIPAGDYFMLIGQDSPIPGISWVPIGTGNPIKIS